MTIDEAAAPRRYTVQVRQRGQITLPSQARQALALAEGDALTLWQVGDALVLTSQAPRFPALADRLAELLDETGLSLADLLQDLPRIRSDIYRETYGGNAV